MTAGSIQFATGFAMAHNNNSLVKRVIRQIQQWTARQPKKDAALYSASGSDSTSGSASLSLADFGTKRGSLSPLSDAASAAVPALREAFAARCSSVGSAKPGGGQSSTFIPRLNPNLANTSLISVSDFLPRFGVFSSSD